jgi:hypothetical protein
MGVPGLISVSEKQRCAWIRASSVGSLSGESVTKGDDVQMKMLN